MKSDSRLDVAGTEGVSIESRSVEMSAGHDVLLKSEGSLTLSANSGRISVDPRALPVGGAGESRLFFNLAGLENQLKLCVCYPSGLVFHIPVSDSDAAEMSTFQGNASSSEGTFMAGPSCGDRHLWDYDPCEVF